MLSRRGIGDAVQKTLSHQERTDKYMPQDQRVFTEKLKQKLYRAFFIIEMNTQSVERLADLLILLDNHLAGYAYAPYNALEWVERPFAQYVEEIHDDSPVALQWYEDLLKLNLARKEYPPELILEPRELASLWHLPNEQFSAKRIQWLPRNQVSLPADIVDNVKEGTDKIYLGQGKYQGREETVYLSETDRRTHINIIGKTGMGKSNFIHHLVHQDIASGRGVAVIDPHGRLIQDILESSIPEEREEDLILLDLANGEFPPPINPMRGDLGTVGIGRVMSIFERLYADVDQYVRLAKYLQAAIGLLAEDDTPTMRDISRVFTDDAYRHALLNNTENPFVLDVWETYETQSVAQRGQIHEPILSRIAPFYGNLDLYPILCHPDSLNFKHWIQSGKIVLVSLAVGKVGKTQISDRERDLIGALLISMIQMAGMEEEQAQTFYVYVDEVQKFVTTSLDEMLSEARKFGLSLTVANQYLGQLTGKTLDAVMGNVGTHIVFRPGAEDARALALHMRPQFQSEDLVNLDRYTAATKLQNEGTTQPAFTLFALPPLDRADNAQTRAARLRQLATKQTQLKPKSEIMAWLKSRYPRRRFGDEANISDYD